MKKPFLTIIAACYNSERFLERLIDSLKAQTFQDFEVFIVDCNSEDNTYKTAFRLSSGLSNFGTAKLTGRNDYVNGTVGICQAFNFPIKYGLANGSYIWCIHADTWLEPNCLSEMAKYARNGHQFFTARELRYDSDSDIHPNLCPHGAKGLDILGSPVDPEPPPGACHILYGGNLSCFSRAMFDKIGGYDEWMKICGDEQDNGWRVAIAGQTAGFAFNARIHHWLKDQKPLREFECERMYKCTVNQGYYILKNAQHFLLLMCPVWLAISALQSIVLAFLCRKPSIVYWLGIRPTLTLLKPGTILQIFRARRAVKKFRVHGDLWFFRKWICLTWGQWSLAKKLAAKVWRGIWFTTRMAN